MPEVSRFFGIVIAMFYSDHRPPHFHARYGGAQAIIAIESLSVLGGELPPRALGLVMEWARGTPGRTSRGLGTGASAGTSQEDRAVGVTACS